MQRKKSTKDTRNAAYKRLKKQFELYVGFNKANQRELRRLHRVEVSVKRLERELKSRIAEIDKRIERRNGANFHDETIKIDQLHCEALAYEKVLELLKTH